VRTIDYGLGGTRARGQAGGRSAVQYWYQLAKVRILVHVIAIISPLPLLLENLFLYLALHGITITVWDSEKLAF